MFVGYIRFLEVDSSSEVKSQRDALLEAGVDERYIYEDVVSGPQQSRPSLDACLKSLRQGDVLVVTSLDRIARGVRQLSDTIVSIHKSGARIRVLENEGLFDTTREYGELLVAIMGLISKCDQALSFEKTKTGMVAARARGKSGGSPRKMNRQKLRVAVAAMQNRETSISALCRELKISRHTLYRYVSPDGELRERGKLLEGGKLEGKEKE